MKPQILLFGKDGQVGRELALLLPNLGNLTAVDRGEFDLVSSDEIRSAIRASSPNLIVNAAAYTAVDKAESDEPAAFAINAQAPIVPISISGSHKLMLKDQWAVHPGTICITIHSPVSTTGASQDDRPRIMEQVRQAILAGLGSDERPLEKNE